MALPTVTINNSTGSNTAASGAGPATAVSGTLAATTNGSPIITLTADNPDLSGIATDGSAVAYVASGGTRKFSKITAVDNTAGVKTITCEDNWTTNAAVNWGVGGKRKDFETTNEHTKCLWTDSKPGWTVDIEQTGTDYVLTTAISWNCVGTAAGGRIVYKSSSATRPIITSATSGIHIFTADGNIGYSELQHLKFTHTGVTRGRVINYNGGSGPIWLTDLVVDGCLEVVNVAYVFSPIYVYGGEYANCTGTNAVFYDVLQFRSYGVDYHDNAGDAVRGVSGYGSGLQVLMRNKFDSNGGKGVNFTDAFGGELVLINNTFYNQTSDGVKIVDGTDTSTIVILTHIGNAYYGNGGYGVHSAEDQIATRLLANANNAYGNNTSGARLNLAAGDNDVTLAEDPFINAAGRDFTPDATAGLRGAGYGGEDIGAVQHVDSGGGGLLRPVPMSGGLI